MKVYGIKCNNCGDIVYSRARHDFRWCSCHSCAVDGGQDEGCASITGNKKNWEFANIEVDATLKDLYNDWNSGTNKYGIKKGR